MIPQVTASVPEPHTTVAPLATDDAANSAGERGRTGSGGPASVPSPQVSRTAKSECDVSSTPRMPCRLGCLVTCVSH